MEQLYWKHQPKVTNDDRVEAIERLKNQLELSRSRVREQLKGAEIRSHDIGVEDNNPVKQAFIDLMKEASVNCTSEMLALAKSTIDFSLQLVSQEPLCPFQVVAMVLLLEVRQHPILIWSTCFWLVKSLNRLWIILKSLP